MKILIVDDNQSITRMMAKVLALEGHECTVCNRGVNAIPLMTTTRFDCVLLDLAMPEKSGVEIIQELADTGQIKNQNIIVLTASSNSVANFDEFKKKGVFATLTKPVNIDSLLHVLKSSCAIKQ